MVRVMFRFVRRSLEMLRDRSGATAIEFAMVAPIFFLIMLGLLEIGITYGAQAQLQYAANEAARQVRTGQVHAKVMPQIAEDIANEARRRGVVQGVLIEEAWALYKKSGN